MPILTVFTPTYNRAHTLPRVFERLRAQTSPDFVWLVIDDGSTDNTADLVSIWKSSAGFAVHYLHQQNRGKHNAHNTAVALAETELFTILDSDDELLPEAVENITSAWKGTSEVERKRIAGIWTLCVDPAGNLVGGPLKQPVLDCSLQELRYKHNIDQEMLASFSTAALRQYPFPETPPGACPYIPEGYVWMRMTRTYEFRFLNVPCRVYHEGDGLSVMERQPYRVGGCIVYSYLGPLTNELEWFWYAPASFVTNAIQAVRYSLYSRQFLKLSRTLPWKARLLTVAALPVSILLLARDWISGRIARERGAARMVTCL